MMKFSKILNDSINSISNVFITLIFLWANMLSYYQSMKCSFNPKFIIKFNQQMQKLLSRSQTLIKYNYLQSHKKPVVGMPSTTPPKYIYEVKYLPSSMPDFDMKFKDHKHFDAWSNIFYTETTDKATFQYSGQWWNAVGVSGRVLVLVSSIWLILSLYEAAEQRKMKHLPGFLSYYMIGDISISHLPTIIQN